MNFSDTSSIWKIRENIFTTKIKEWYKFYILLSKFYWKGILQILWLGDMERRK